MPIEVELSQQNFLMQGGIYARVLLDKKKRGEIPAEYVYREYPKMLRIFKGTREVERSTEVGNGSRKVEWTETVEDWDEIIVTSEAEEDRVRAGGKTAPQVEEDRQALIRRCHARHIQVDPSWSATRLRRELGEEDAPAAPNKMESMQAELDDLRKMADMQAEIERLREQVARGSGDDAGVAIELRRQLTDLGVRVDGRWSVVRMREELDKATAPREAA